MTTSTQPRNLSLASVDDFLGARESRFFGEGFTKVTHTLTGIVITPAPTGGTIEARAGIRTPGAWWSRKGETDQRPHLSTIDVMIFGAQLIGLYLAHAHGLRSEDPFLIRRLAVKAGVKPQEDELDKFSVSGRALNSSPSDDRYRTTLDCQIGSLLVQVTAEYRGSAPTQPSPGSYATAADLPGPWNSAPYGRSHHRGTASPTAVEADLNRLTASAELGLTSGTNGQASEPTVIELFASALQLGQVLLYALDGVGRAETNTLWMRRASVESTPAPVGSRLAVALEEPSLLPTKQGIWRSADIVTSHGGHRLRCSVAHLLPEQSR